MGINKQLKGLTYYGKPLSDHTKEELIKIIEEFYISSTKREEDLFSDLMFSLNL